MVQLVDSQWYKNYKQTQTYNSKIKTHISKILIKRTLNSFLNSHHKNKELNRLKGQQGTK